jgi:AcrR family transcriptional regulator
MAEVDCNGRQVEMAENFVRARSTAQKALRQVRILDAARVVIREQGIEAVTMAKLAKEAGTAQSAFYRYFKSKDEIMAHLLIAEADKMTDDLRSGLLDSTDLPQAAKRFAGLCAARPLFCTLASDLARLLERNIALDRLVDIKREFARVMGEWVAVFLDSGAVSQQDIAVQFLRSANIVLAGLWPMTRDRPDVLEAVRQVGLYDPYGDFETEFSAQLTLLADGLIAS